MSGSFAKRKQLKEAFDLGTEEYVEKYLERLDPFRFCSAKQPLPLPTFEQPSTGVPKTVASTVLRLLEVAGGDRPASKKLLPELTPGSQITCQVASLYKSIYWSSPYDTITFSFPFDKATRHQQTWFDTVHAIKSYLIISSHLWFETSLPYDITGYVVEIVDPERCWNPDRVELTATTDRYSLWQKLFNDAKPELQTFIQTVLFDDYVDITLELQSQHQRSQVAIVVEVLPGSIFKWAWLREQILLKVADQIGQAADHQYLGEDVRFEVEFMPNYEAPILINSKAVVLKNLKARAPELFLNTHFPTKQELTIEACKGREDVDPQHPYVGKLAADAAKGCQRQSKDSTYDSAPTSARGSSQIPPNAAKFGAAGLSAGKNSEETVRPKSRHGLQRWNTEGASPTKRPDVIKSNKSSHSSLDRLERIPSPVVPLDYGRDIHSAKTVEDLNRVDWWTTSAARLIASETPSEQAQPGSERGQALSRTSDLGRSEELDPLLPENAPPESAQGGGIAEEDIVVGESANSIPKQSLDSNSVPKQSLGSSVHPVQDENLAPDYLPPLHDILTDSDSLPPVPRPRVNREPSDEVYLFPNGARARHIENVNKVPEDAAPSPSPKGSLSRVKEMRVLWKSLRLGKRPSFLREKENGGEN